MHLLHHARASIRTQHIASKLSHYFTCYKTSPIFLSIRQPKANKMLLSNRQKRIRSPLFLTE